MWLESLKRSINILLCSILQAFVGLIFFHGKVLIMLLSIEMKHVLFKRIGYIDTLTPLGQNSTSAGMISF